MEKKIKYKLYKNGRLVNVSYSMLVNEYGEKEEKATLEKKIQKDLRFYSAYNSKADLIEVYVDNEFHSEIML